MNDEGGSKPTMAASALASNGLILENGKTRSEDIFFSVMALVILGTVFLGFARSYYLAGAFRAHLPNLLVHIHAAVFSAWILLFIAQITLISGNRVDLHRRVGIFGAGLAALMIVLGFLVATDALSRGFVPPGSNIDPKSFYSIQFLSVAVFGVLIVWALRARSDGPAHKRLTLIATISLMAAAVNRWPIPLFHSGPVTEGVLTFYVLLLAGFDLWSRKRIHRATMQGGLFMIVCHQLMFPIGLTHPWHRFAAAALRLWTAR